MYFYMFVSKYLKKYDTFIYIFLKGCHVVNNGRRIMYHPSFDRKLNKL